MFSQNYHQHVISFCLTPKHYKYLSPSLKKAKGGSLCTYFKQEGCETEVECLIIPHLTKCHCHFTSAKLSCLHLFSTVKLMSDAQKLLQCISFIITNDNKSVPVRPHEKCEWTGRAVWLLILSHHTPESSASCWTDCDSSLSARTWYLNYSFWSW